IVVAGFCIKTKSNDDEKVFINICHTKDLPTPNEISESELLELLQSEEAPNYRVPMSIGQSKSVTDKQGNPAKAYDVAISTQFFNKIENKEFFKNFLITLVLEAVSDKYNVTLNTTSVNVLKNRKCMGSLQLHRVQKREMDTAMGVQPKKLIQEIETSYKPIISELRVPKFRLTGEPSTGTLETIIGEIFLPEVKSVKNLELDVGEDRIVLKENQYNYDLDIFLPHLINQDKVSASLNKNNGILKLTLPILSSI
ncbi:PIH1 domain-containing protein 1, partial [Chrysoperla carnea]|uniref:PIH1 domain-containing protein 1 n=1 Tax=Chrysoperla carnea TaxID=189513 RepID=UPI001D098FBD